MKRLFWFIVLLMANIFTICAQNSNRSGLFIEVGLGGVVGSTPTEREHEENGVIHLEGASGASFQIAIGGRVPIINRHWAYEGKIEALSSFSNLDVSLVLRCLPLGLRYSSSEIWKNISLYGHFDLGAALSRNNGNHYKEKIQGWMDGTGGLAYSLGLGLNLTPRIYLECSWNGQSLFNAKGKTREGTLTGGIMGVTLGYRLF